ncbi:hypothetical protein Gotur_002941, partial [Gossypium turneri]
MARLINDDPHISDTANNMGSYHVLRGRVNVIGYPSDSRLMPYLEQAGFGSAELIRMFDLRYDLISALVERWPPETLTFHFPCGECTVTLEDVALQLGLPIDGSPVTRVTAFIEPAALCYQLLGDSPNDDELGLHHSSSVVSGALLDDKAFCCRHGRMPYIVAVLGALSDAIFFIG